LPYSVRGAGRVAGASAGPSSRRIVSRKVAARGLASRGSACTRPRAGGSEATCWATRSPARAAACVARCTAGVRHRRQARARRWTAAPGGVSSMRTCSCQDRYTWGRYEAACGVGYVRARRAREIAPAVFSLGDGDRNSWRAACVCAYPGGASAVARRFPPRPFRLSPVLPCTDPPCSASPPPVAPSRPSAR
jgi:hypothetical protein